MNKINWKTVFDSAADYIISSYALAARWLFVGFGFGVGLTMGVAVVIGWLK
ncbi:hypothetical protein [Advenella mimigardefordensis]|uniref:hypothetical protein n=1 Tax=Advenella mimigardefordensis TaxID=302406 RepID=UPI0004B415A3|nr:hypothetical protein [Advenella mimigardefordensis]